MGLTRRKAQKWANALRSGEYSQTMGTLEDEQGFCCLGVACKIFIPKNKQQLRYSKEEAFRAFLSGDVTKDQPNAPKWLQEVDEELKDILSRNKTELEEAEEQLNEEKAALGYSFYKDPGSFVEMNDDDGYTFNEIADIIELIFVHKALK